MSQEALKAAPAIRKVKTVLRDITSDSNQSGIAALLGVTHQDISQRFTPGNPRKPALFEGLRESWAVCVENDDSGWKLKAYVVSLFDSWLNPVKATEKTITALIQEGHESYGKVITARLEGRPLGELREELQRARKAIDQLESALDNEFELKSENEVRQFSKRAG